MVKCLFGYHTFKQNTATGIISCKCSLKFTVADMGIGESEAFPKVDERPYFKLSSDTDDYEPEIVVSNIKLSQEEVNECFDFWWRNS